MDIETFREFCLSFAGTTEGMKWGEHLCFMIEEKMFLIISLENEHSFSFKVNPEDFDALVARNGIQQASHMAKRQWVQVENLEVLPDDELKERIAQSRTLVIGKLTKKVQGKYCDRGLVFSSTTSAQCFFGIPFLVSLKNGFGSNSHK